MKLSLEQKQISKLVTALPIEKMPEGTVVHNVELKPGKGGQWLVVLEVQLKS